MEVGSYPEVEPCSHTPALRRAEAKSTSPSPEVCTLRWPELNTCFSLWKEPHSQVGAVLISIVGDSTASSKGHSQGKWVDPWLISTVLRFISPRILAWNQMSFLGFVPNLWAALELTAEWPLSETQGATLYCPKSLGDIWPHARQQFHWAWRQLGWKMLWRHLLKRARGTSSSAGVGKWLSGLSTCCTRMSSNL